MEDEINLREYINVLLRQWKLITVITVIAIVIAGLISFLSPAIYEANTSVLITKARTEIVLVPEYRSAYQQDSTSMRQALLSMVKSPMVAYNVIEKIGVTLEPSEQKVSSLLNSIDMSNEGDLIKISVKSSDPMKAAIIANTWTESYINYVNSFYTGIPSMQELQAQVNSAMNKYKEKQKAFEDFIKNNRLADLTQQIREKEALYDARSLLEYAKSNPSSPGNRLSLILLQTRVLTSLPEGLQISLDPVTGSNSTIDDINAFISTLEARGGKQNQSLTDIRKDIMLLRAEYEQENAKYNELQDARNIARKAYTTIADKNVETQISAQGQANIVKFATFATAPESPIAPRKVINICIALVLGVVIGIFAAFVAEYFNKTGKKFWQSRNQ